MDQVKKFHGNTYHAYKYIGMVSSFKRKFHGWPVRFLSVFVPPHFLAKIIWGGVVERNEIWPSSW